MKIVIVGCGRVGASLAENLDADGHEVIIFDIKTAAFDRLPETFKGAAVRGDGTDEAVLRQAGAQGADIFLSLTEGDNRNIMAAQVATESFGIPGDRQDQRSRSSRRLLGARRRHSVPDQPHGRFGGSIPGPADANGPRHRHPRDTWSRASAPFGGNHPGPCPRSRRPKGTRRCRHRGLIRLGPRGFPESDNERGGRGPGPAARLSALAWLSAVGGRRVRNCRWRG